MAAASEEALAARNAASKQVGQAKAAGDEAEFERLRALVAAKKDEIARVLGTKRRRAASPTRTRRKKARGRDTKLRAGHPDLVRQNRRFMLRGTNKGKTYKAWVLKNGLR